MAKKTIIKEKIECPLCQKQITKKYFSQHIRCKHSDNIYCKIVKRGMTYNIFNFNINNESKGEQYHCKTCNKYINKYSKYKHIKTKLHLFLERKEKDLNKFIKTDLENPEKSNESCNSREKEFQISNNNKNDSCSSNNDDDSSSYLPKTFRNRRDPIIWGPDVDRIEKEVDDVIKSIENAKNKKNSKK